MGLFEIGKIGLPVMLLGIAYMCYAGPRYLPSKLGLSDVLERPKEYITGMLVKSAEECENEAPLLGKTIAQAGLRQLEGLFVFQIERANGDVLNAPGPETVLQAGDKLLFAGVVSSVLSLAQIRGLKPIEDEEDYVDLYRMTGDDILVEAVIAPRSAMVHRTVREVKFRCVPFLPLVYFTIQCC